MTNIRYVNRIKSYSIAWDCIVPLLASALLPANKKKNTTTDPAGCWTRGALFQNGLKTHPKIVNAKTIFGGCCVQSRNNPFTASLNKGAGRRNNLSIINGLLSCISQIAVESAAQSKFKVFSYLFDHSRSLLIGGGAGSNKRRIQINSLQLLGSSRAERPSVGPAQFGEIEMTFKNFC